MVVLLLICVLYVHDGGGECASWFHVSAEDPVRRDPYVPDRVGAELGPGVARHLQNQKHV